MYKQNLLLQDEGTFQLKGAARKYLTELGSTEAESLNWRDTWAFITIKGGETQNSPRSDDVLENVHDGKL